MDLHCFCWLIFACAQAIIIPYRYDKRSGGSPFVMDVKALDALRIPIEQCVFPFVETMVESTIALKNLSKTASVSLLYVPADLWNLYVIFKAVDYFKGPMREQVGLEQLDKLPFVEAQLQKQFLEFVHKVGIMFSKKRSLKQLSMDECDRIIRAISPLIKEKFGSLNAKDALPMGKAFGYLLGDLDMNEGGLIHRAIEAETGMFRDLKNVIWRSCPRVLVKFASKNLFAFDFLANYADGSKLGAYIDKNLLENEKIGTLKFHYSLLSGFFEFDGDVDVDTCPFLLKSILGVGACTYFLELNHFDIWNVSTYTTFPPNSTTLDVFSGSSSRKVEMKPNPENAFEAETFVMQNANTIDLPELQDGLIQAQGLLHDLVGEKIEEKAMNVNIDLARPFFIYCYNLAKAIGDSLMVETLRKRNIDAKVLAELIFTSNINRTCLRRTHTKALEYANRSLRDMIVQASMYDQTVLEGLRREPSSTEWASFMFPGLQREMEYLEKGGVAFIIALPEFVETDPEESGLDDHDKLEDLLSCLYLKWAVERFINQMKYIAGIDCGVIEAIADLTPEDTVKPWKIAMVTFASELFKSKIPIPASLDSLHNFYNTPYPQGHGEEIEMYCVGEAAFEFKMTLSRVMAKEEINLLTYTGSRVPFLQELYNGFPPYIKDWTTGRVFMLAIKFLSRIYDYLNNDCSLTGRVFLQTPNSFLVRNFMYRKYPIVKPAPSSGSTGVTPDTAAVNPSSPSDHQSEPYTPHKSQTYSPRDDSDSESYRRSSSLGSSSFTWGVVILLIVIVIALVYRSRALKKKEKERQERMEALSKCYKPSPFKFYPTKS